MDALKAPFEMKGLCGLLASLLIFPSIIWREGTSSAYAQQPAPAPSASPATGAMPPSVLDESASSARDLLNRLIVFLSGEPFDTEREIDRIVGDPTVLEPDTASRMQTLPSRLRYQLFSALAQRWTPTNLTSPDRSSGSSAALTDPTGPLPPAWSLQLDPEAGRLLLWTLIDATEAHFSTEQLIDMLVFAMHRIGIGPQSRESWSRWKRFIVRSEVELALAFVAIQAALNQGIIRVTGNITSIADGLMRLGWHAEVRRLGVELNPRLAGGLILNSRFLEVITSIVYQAQAAPNAEVLAWEASVRGQWTIRENNSSRWNFTAIGRTRFLIIHNDPQQEGRIVGELEVFAHRPTFSTAFPDLLFSANAATDFATRFQGGVGVGIELPSYDTTGLLQVSITSPDPSTGAIGYQFRLFGAGSLESQRDRYQRRLFILAHNAERILNTHRSLLRQEQAISRSLRAFGTNALTPAAERAGLYRWRFMRRDLNASRERLERGLEDYESLLAIFWDRYARPLPSPTADREGPLDPQLIRDMRQILQPDAASHSQP